MDYRFADTMKHFQSSAVREILKLTQGKSVISFAGGLPAEELFPAAAIREAFNRIFEQGNSALQYGLTEGFLPLREALCARMARKNMRVPPRDMLVTTGSQQAIDLLAKVYLDPGDTVLVQEPTYLAALQVFQSHGAKVISVAGDPSGMDPEQLEAKIAEHRPKMVYVSPTFSNPTGYVWSLERRQALLDSCRRNNVLILEDDPYGELQYGSDETYPSIFSLDQHPEGSAVVYTSTFSKIAAPGLRTGWVIGDPTIIRSMAQAKQAADLQSSTMDQQALYYLLRDFDLDGHIALIRANYEERMRLMVSLLEGLGRDDLRWNEPKGGMFLWLELPETLHAEHLLPLAVEKGVAFVPGSSFYAERPKHNTIRLNFTHSDRETMITGMERFAAALEEVRVRA
ncbi:PLP-dependent aminotransferase family protein [Paenibacillus sp. CC-CFT747]|nr:PLP-dependent aminotransferase family protein [Paenibacillus sp. CC-CFT747]